MKQLTVITKQDFPFFSNGRWLAGQRHPRPLPYDIPRATGFGMSSRRLPPSTWCPATPQQPGREVGLKQ